MGKQRFVPNEALAELLRQDAEAEGADRFGRFAGEMSVPSREPVPEPPPPLSIPPPDWGEAEDYLKEETP